MDRTEINLGKNVSLNTSNFAKLYLNGNSTKEIPIVKPVKKEVRIIIAIISHVVSTKKTTTGRLTYKFGSTDKCFIERFKKDAAEMNKGSFKHVQVLDKLKIEKKEKNMKGFGDMEDLPLNIFCGVLRQNMIFFKMAENKEDYNKFYKAISRDIKMGINKDFHNKGKRELSKYHSTKSCDEMTSFKEYVTRIKEGQNDIWYISGERKKLVENLSFLEKLNKKRFQVLYMVDAICEYVFDQLKDYEGKKLFATKEGLKLAESDDKKNKKEKQKEKFDVEVQTKNLQLKEAIRMGPVLALESKINIVQQTKHWKGPDFSLGFLMPQSSLVYKLARNLKGNPLLTDLVGEQEERGGRANVSIQAKREINDVYLASTKSIISEAWEVVGGGKQEIVQADGINRCVLRDIVNLVTTQAIECKPENQDTRPVTRSFGAQLLANAAEKNISKKPLVESMKNVAAKAVLVISLDEKESGRKARNRSSKKRSKIFTSILSARSKAACGITKKPKDVVVDIDAEDVENEPAAAEYVEDMYNYYKLIDGDGRVRDYMESQPEINSLMRGILVDWLIEVHMKFELTTESLYLTGNIMDRSLSLKGMARRELQLVGISSMLIVCKYEDIWAPEVNDLIPISDNAYAREQVLVLEKFIRETSSKFDPWRQGSQKGGVLSWP